MKLKNIGICGIIGLISYAAMVFISPIAYPGYNMMTMAVSDLSAVGAPSAALAKQLNALYNPCALVCIMAVCVAVERAKSKVLKAGIFCFAGMQWVTSVGYSLFPWVADADEFCFQNVMHLVVTVLVVLLSIAALVLIIIGGRKEGLKSLSIWAAVCFAAMLAGALGTGLLPKSVFGLFERFSTFSAVVFNAVLGMYLFLGKFE